MSEQEGNYQVSEEVERTAIPPFVAPTGYIPNASQPSQRHDSETLRSDADAARGRCIRSLGEEIVAINRANGWNVCQPQDWNDAPEDALKQWRFEPAHYVDSENCMGERVAYWRVFADRPLPASVSPKEATRYHATKCGTGLTAEQALEQCKRNILDDPVAAYKIPAVLALVTSEVSEALEAFRKRDRANFEEEMADVLIRVLDCTHGLGIDLEPVIHAKLATNRQRGFRHGGKAV